MKNYTGAMGGLLVALMVWAGTVRAATFTWTGAEDAEWGNANNWLDSEDQPGVPGASDTARFTDAVTIVNQPAITVSADHPVHGILFGGTNNVTVTMSGPSTRRLLIGADGIETEEGATGTLQFAGSWDGGIGRQVVTTNQIWNIRSGTVQFNRGLDSASGIVVTKRGQGMLKFGASNSDYFSGSVRFEESYSEADGRQIQNWTHVHVGSGAELNITYSFGSSWKLSGAGRVAVSTLTHSGTIAPGDNGDIGILDIGNTFWNGGASLTADAVYDWKGVSPEDCDRIDVHRHLTIGGTLKVVNAGRLLSGDYTVMRWGTVYETGEITDNGMALDLSELSGGWSGELIVDEIAREVILRLKGPPRGTVFRFR